MSMTEAERQAYEDLSALLYKLRLHRTDREMCFGANGSRFIECIKGPNG